MRALYLTTCLAAFLGFGGLSSALAASEPTSQQFVTKAAEGNLAEIKVSQLALDKSQNPQVRQFAQRMIDDHTKANSQLQALAQQKGLKVPDDTDVMHKAAMKMLEAKSGGSFDKSYIEQMQKDHEKALELFQNAAHSAKVNNDLKSFAASTLPTLEQHHQSVTRLAASGM